MRVSEVMTTDVEFIDVAMTVQDAAVTMGELDVGALPVGTAARVEGIVTDRDGSVKNLGRYAASWIAWWPNRPSSRAALT